MGSTPSSVAWARASLVLAAVLWSTGSLFMRLLRDACGVPFGLPANKWMLEIGALFIRTETELILKSRRVVPGRLLEHGFKFKYPDWPDAARDLCHQSKVTRDKALAA